MKYVKAGTTQNDAKEKRIFLLNIDYIYVNYNFSSAYEASSVRLSVPAFTNLKALSHVRVGPYFLIVYEYFTALLKNKYRAGMVNRDLKLL